MWHIYISIVVLFRGAYCKALTTTEKNSTCTVVIKRFGEPVETLEVKWNSDIHLICDASCVGPGPQPGLTWFYRDKNQSKDMNIEQLFQSPKFQTYPTSFHRKNELVIRDFGPNEETDFICNGTIEKQRLEAKVALIGTDCLLKYNFRCKLDNKCIDRAYLCNQHNECPDGEDEIGCATCRGDQFQCADENCVEARMKCDGTPQCEDGSDERNCPSCPPNNFQCETTSQLECVDVSLVCNRFPDCTDRSDEVGCPSCRKDQFTCTDGTCVEGNMRCDGIAQCEDGSDEIGCLVTTAPPAVCTADQYKCASGECVDGRYRCDGQHDCYDGSDEENCPKPCEFQCRNGTCISSTKKCDGIPDCPDGDDEICELPLICPEGRKGCKDLSKCIEDSQLCNGVQDCTDGGDEKDCDLEKKKIIISSTEINDDRDNGQLFTTNGVTDNNGEFTDTTTPFDYDPY